MFSLCSDLRVYEQVAPLHFKHVVSPKVYFKKYMGRDFPGGAVVKNPPANAGDMGSSPGPRRSHVPRSN